MKKVIGRPKKHEADRLSALITFSVTESDAKLVYDAARRRRLNVSTYIRLRLKDLQFFSRINT